MNVFDNATTCGCYCERGCVVGTVGIFVEVSWRTRGMQFYSLTVV